MPWYDRTNATRMSTESIRFVRTSNPVVGLIALLTFLVLLLLAIPLLLLGVAIGIVTLPVVLGYRWAQAKLSRSGREAGRKNVRVIRPGERDTLD